MSMRRAPALLPRTREVTGFTAMLAGFVREHPAVRFVSVVDDQGECVDDATRIPADDALLAAATWSALRGTFSAHAAPLGGTVFLWTLDTSLLGVALRRVSQDLALIAVTRAGFLDARVIDGLHALAERVRDEAGVACEPRDPWGRTVNVEPRPSTRWGYAPRSYALHGSQSPPLEVLGRWSERAAGAVIVHFRVRPALAAGHEVTLCHDTERDRWFLRG